MLSEIDQRILLTLYESNSGLSFTELTSKSKISPNSAKASVDKLIELGLVKEDREKTFPRRRILALTNKGKEVAALLHKILQIVGET